MDKLTMQAFEKMQKAEHRMRQARDRMALGRITQAEFRQQVEAIEARYALTAEEQRAYENHLQRTRKTQ
ncbi:hypothetical protein [Ferviditalea candida]|uniref:Uncharacterized protein n=1 Tax=Ferviditalea candida TaxID=3108399 RepID=A0ABU5ZKR1_9BACL|nr:hypothetical protein [Paenibacillaceae bacterium T2]